MNVRKHLVWYSHICHTAAANVSPGPNGGLQQGAQPRHEEDGGDEMALGRVVVPDAEGLC